MRKKLLTVALAAVMVLGSAVSAFAADSADTSSPELNNSSTTGDADADADSSISDATAEAIEKTATVTGMEGVTLEVSAPSKATMLLVEEAGKTLLADKKFEVVELDLSKGTTKLEQLDNAVKVTLEVFENIKDAKYVDVYRYNTTTKVLDKVATSVEVKDGKFTFETDHFSTYVFAEGVAPAASTETGDTAPIATAVAVAALAAGIYGVVALKKKNA